MRSKRNLSGSDKKGAEDVQKLNAKNVEEIAKRIEGAEAAEDSSDDSPFVSDFEESDGDDEVRVYSLIGFLVWLRRVLFIPFGFVVLVALDRTVSSRLSYFFFSERRKLHGIFSFKER